MPYIDNWEEFSSAAEQLFLSNPSKVGQHFACLFHIHIICTTKETVAMYRIGLAILPYSVKV